jgi:hypothetical protein
MAYLALNLHLWRPAATARLPRLSIIRAERVRDIRNAPLGSDTVGGGNKRFRETGR